MGCSVSNTILRDVCSVLVYGNGKYMRLTNNLMKILD